ncbi:MAG: hypothetical protein LBR30_06050 [Clostridioides sp.]|jgi:hypothetical protein|nr:hypothetical protein [Clostridioides sp.]
MVSKSVDFIEYKNNRMNKNSKKKKTNKIKKKLKVCILIAVGFICIVINLCGYSKISQMRYEITDLEKVLRQKEIQLEGLNANKLKANTKEEIEKKSKEELNMNYPKEEQIEYIDLNE